MGEIVTKKFEDLQAFTKENNITGLEFIGDDATKIARSFFLVEGHNLPMGIVVNDTIYTYIQVIVAPKVKETAYAAVCKYLNGLNDQFPMLKYHIDAAGQVVLTCSLPSDDDNFKPALIFALVDQVKMHLDEVYAKVMKEIYVAEDVEEEVVKAEKTKKSSKK